ncbi:acyl-CoA desaturase [Microvirga mediterraneensis]|uniref:Acyl-CoA desaturase n=1 Tax=Microvirga mediterraneensis TaxID=2754695 RepID=A0A838BHC5_9HYPH|nr:acyl-CoA desaturase [Microvirga mediterraneensis]MBA1154635.1 acyl-CoA desaturase [Microvirga mediterraneensis]
MSSPRPSKTPHHDHHDHDDIIYPQVIPFLLVHAVCFAALWTGVTREAVVLGIILYWLRMFGITAGYHRYFSHRSYTTSRVFQFVLACIAQSSAQKSVLWWAAKHRHHHLFSDTEHDVHSPRHTGFLFAHVGWIFARKHDTVDLVKVGDLTKYPELMWLHKYELLPAIILAVIAFLIAGWPGLIVGFFWSTVAVYHATFCINSLAHVHGSKRYVTGDDSRNNWLLAFFTMGEGWHNNHHAYQASVRQGFRWWEIDPTFYIIKTLSWLGVVWDLKSPPEAVRRNEQKLGSRVIDRAAGDLMATFNIENIATKLSHVLETTPSLADLRAKLVTAEHKAHEVLAQVHLPHLPTRDEVWARGSTMFVKTQSLDDIVERAHRLILEAVGSKLARPAAY